MDYNGRTARLFSNLLMLKIGLPLVEISSETESDRQSYIQALKAADENNYRPLEELLRQAVEETQLEDK